MYLSFLLPVLAALQLAIFADHSAAEDLFMTQGNINGCTAFFPVKRAKLQKLLDKINEESENDVHFYLPASADAPSAELTVMLSFGEVEASSFDPFIGPQDEYTTRADVLMFLIPFLKTSDSAVPEVTLFVEFLKAKNAGNPVIWAYAVYPSEIIEVDRLVINDNFMTLENGAEDRFTMQVQNRICDSPNAEDTLAIGEVEGNRIVSLAATDFEICKKRPDLSVDYCNFYRDHASAFASAGTNICEDWRPTDVKLCSATIEITEASPEMREFLLLEDDVTRSLHATCQNGVFDIFVKAPCIGE